MTTKLRQVLTFDPGRSSLQPQRGLLQQTITWYKIRHAGGQAHYYSPTETLKQRDLNQSSLTCLCFNVPVGE